MKSALNEKRSLGRKENYLRCVNVLLCIFWLQKYVLIKADGISGQLNLVLLDQHVRLINILQVLSCITPNEHILFGSVRSKEDGKTVNKFIFKNPFEWQEHKPALSLIVIKHTTENWGIKPWSAL